MSIENIIRKRIKMIALTTGEYPEEIEYMYITHLLRTAVLRFLD